uniref:Adhesion G protein-coupled receptor A3 n=1 Tax=Cacopsylla melanoneura TaxID=428564 RepID=A0A8D8V4M1_9HEMI
MKEAWIVMILLTTSLVPNLTQGEALCPLKCACSKVKPKTQFSFGDLYKLKCGTVDDPIQSLDELSFHTYPNIADVSTLDLSHNEITKIPTNAFYFPNLQKLDLDKNELSVIEPGAFSNLTNLKTLILSNNKISFLSKELFEGLGSLQSLKLGQNALVQLKEGTFVPLSSISKIDLSGNPFLCDCELYWLHEWAYNNSVKLSPGPKCGEPPNVRGQLLQTLHTSSSTSKLKLLEKCDWLVPDEQEFLELRPSNDQLVFEGDSLKLQCRVVNFDVTNDETFMNWSWGGRDPNIVFDQTVQIESKFPKDSGIRESTLLIDHITKNHSGSWQCQFTTGDVTHTITISVIVISGDTKYCPSTTTNDNRGSYTWPKTVVGFTCELPCAVLPDDDYQDEADLATLRATRQCSPEAEWGSVNTSLCPFVEANTRLLQHYARMNLTARVGRGGGGQGDTVVSAARELLNLISNELSSLRDPIDVAFIARALENFVEFVPREKELGSILIDITSAVMRLPKALLLLAEEKEGACSRLVRSVESISPTLQSHPSSLAVEAWKITRESFFGITCSWYSGDVTGRFFLCDASNKTAQLVTRQKVLESSVQVPADLFFQLELRGSHSTSHQLLIVMYETAQLFPRRSPPDGKDVLSSVVGIKLVDIDVTGLSSRISVTVRVPSQSPPSSLNKLPPPIPVWWDEVLGDWRSDGCVLSRSVNELLTFDCDRFGYFGLLEHVQPQVSRGPGPTSSSHGFHPIVYVGTFIGVTCLLTSTLSYITCYTSIAMGEKMKHALIHTWVCMSVFCLVFALGSRQTDVEQTCQWIGVALHYFCLCSLFWMAVTVKVMYKRLPKPKLGSSSSSDDLPHDDIIVVKKPILGVYMVGYGISLIICGLSSAVNMRGYAGQNYCFLSPGPALSAIIIPSIILLVFLGIMCLLVRCIALSHLDSNAQLSDGTQATDLELMEGTGCNLPTERTSLHSVLTPSSQLEDTEHSPLTHLKAFIMVLVIYLLLVVSGALSTMTPQLLYIEELLFSILYCVFCILLGVFVLFFYCFTRTDVRSGWFKKSKPLYRSRNVIDSNNVPLPVLSNSQSLSSSNQMKSIAVDLNGSAHKNDQLGKGTSLGLVVLKQRQPSNDNIINNFYNPHQSTAARKFFKKQRRKQTNTLALRPTHNGCDTLNSSILGGQSKINNTNIHVDLPLRESKDKNLHERSVERYLEDKPLHNNDGTLRSHDTITPGPEYVELDDSQPGRTKMSKCNNSEYSTEEFVTSQVSESGGEREECSCEGVSDPASDLGTDCGRDISTKLSCGSSHAIVSDVSDVSSHLYATVAPEIADSSLERSHRRRAKEATSSLQGKYKIHNDLMGERRKKSNQYKNYSLPRRKRGKQGEEEDKRETCL